MRPESRQLVAHLAMAVSRYIPEAQREAREGGYALPDELVVIADFLTDCARTRQDATSRASSVTGLESGVMTDSLVLTKAEAAALLRISVRQLERLIRAGDLNAVRVGDGATRVRRQDLDAYVAGLAPGSLRDDLETKGGAA